MGDKSEPKGNDIATKPRQGVQTLTGFFAFLAYRPSGELGANLPCVRPHTKPKLRG